MTFFELLILGHFVGDYLIQNSWMALNKTKKWLPLLVHVALYTLSVCLFTAVFTGFNPWWILVVFLSHLFIDRWSLADKYLELTGSRSLKMFFDKDKVWDCRIPEIALTGGFSAFVYVVVDNTMHVLLMVLGAFLLKFIGG
jgi:hypothetical protein